MDFDTARQKVQEYSKLLSDLNDLTQLLKETEAANTAANLQIRKLEAAQKQVPAELISAAEISALTLTQLEQQEKELTLSVSAAYQAANVAHKTVVKVSQTDGQVRVVVPKTVFFAGKTYKTNVSVTRHIVNGVGNNVFGITDHNGKVLKMKYNG